MYLSINLSRVNVAAVERLVVWSALPGHVDLYDYQRLRCWHSAYQTHPADYQRAQSLQRHRWVRSWDRLSHLITVSCCPSLAVTSTGDQESFWRHHYIPQPVTILEIITTVSVIFPQSCSRTLPFPFPYCVVFWRITHAQILIILTNCVILLASLYFSYNYSICIDPNVIRMCMGARGHGQEGALAPSGNVVKCFCAFVVTAKRSLDELFMHYFHKLSSASGVFAPRTPPGLHPWTPLGDFCPHTPNLPTPEKKSCARQCPCAIYEVSCFRPFATAFDFTVIDSSLISDLENLFNNAHSRGEYYCQVSLKSFH